MSEKGEYVTGRYRDFLLDVSRGFVDGAEPFYGYGRITTTGAASGVLWPDGTFETPVIGGEPFEIVSTSAQDGVNGTGIQSVHVHYLDLNLDAQERIVTLNGLTAVSSATLNPPIPDCRFVQCMHIETFGSGKAAAGDIYLRRIGGDAQNFAMIALGKVRCASSVRMVPRGKRLIITGAVASSTSGTAAASCRVELAASMIDSHNYVYPSVFIPMAGIGFQDNGFGMNMAPLAAVPEGVLVGLTFTIDKAGTISGSWFGFLETV